MQNVPAISFLLTFIIIVVAIIKKFTGDQLASIFAGKNVVLVCAVLLFFILATLHLFQPQTWTADVLKVIVGVLVGVTSTYSSDAKKDEKNTSKDPNVDISASGNFGDNTKIAGRDINETIQQMENEIAQIKDSVINQYPKIEKSLSEIPRKANEPSDYLINTIYERFYQSNTTSGMTKAVETVINHWQSEGWTFSSVTSDYSGIDGMILLFTRPSQDGQSKVTYRHGSQLEVLR